MKKVLLILLVCTLCVLMIGCQAESPLTDEEAEQVKQEDPKDEPEQTEQEDPKDESEPFVPHYATEEQWEADPEDACPECSSSPCDCDELGPPMPEIEYEEPGKPTYDGLHPLYFLFGPMLGPPGVQVERDPIYYGFDEFPRGERLDIYIGAHQGDGILDHTSRFVFVLIWHDHPTEGEREMFQIERNYGGQHVTGEYYLRIREGIPLYKTGKWSAVVGCLDTMTILGRQYFYIY